MLAARLAGCGRRLLLLGPALLRQAAPAGPASLHCSARRLRGARVAVVLSGCGVYDGTEIHEASAILVHLSRGGAEVQMYAPDIPQMHVIDHRKGQPAEAESRNVLVESARIARGKIMDLAKLTTKDHDAVIFPGGFGAAKNLSTFAVDGKDCKVNGEVERVLQEFHKAGKPIGLCCISPVLAVKVLPGAEVTVGHEGEEGGKWPYAGTAEAIKALGGKHCAKEVTAWTSVCFSPPQGSDLSPTEVNDLIRFSGCRIELQALFHLFPSKYNQLIYEGEWSDFIYSKKNTCIENILLLMNHFP
ncbi:glutamine amidotransferase-like class 1 domain-containing protein 3, mitochondrial isoform X1 [Emydura macquarii macquarii]|uniref:glutamine amidotransferase-like class 1 domain-containing protein 3, mitochondrial isoform X1 n=1 Tax=Emydura macquarii macquarii TaxID=1129001 RepID=UPI00352A6BBA